jgi:hypothetical protein
MGSLINELAERAGVRVQSVGAPSLIAAADVPAFLDACSIAKRESYVLKAPASKMVKSSRR